ncbi:GtrA family protein [Methylophilales bacterium]|nr:GtrA family protein [Methylophilales bacterium]
MFKFFDKKFIVFLMVGILNTFFGLVILFFLSLTDIDTWLVLLISQLVGLAFNFFTTGNYVFNITNLKLVPKFLVVSIFIYFLFLFSINLILPFVSNRTIAIIILVIPFALLNFIIYSGFVFKKKK